MPGNPHDPEQTAWLDSHFYVWSRFVCREGLNRCETFDFESLRWLQLHIRLPVGDGILGIGGLER